jgi:hypothetical protein
MEIGEEEQRIVFVCNKKREEYGRIHLNNINERYVVIVI